MVQALLNVFPANPSQSEILHHRNAKIVERYNKYTYKLPSLQAGDTVAIQIPLNHRWNTTWKIITALPDRRYRIRFDGSGSITLRNLCFLRKYKLKFAPTPTPSATPGPITPSSKAPLFHLSTTSGNDAHTAIEPHKQTTCTSPRLRQLISLYRDCDKN